MHRFLFCFVLAGLPTLALPAPSEAQDGLAPPPQPYTLENLLRLGRERNPHLLSLRAQEAARQAHRRDAGRLMNPELELATGEGDPFESPETKTVRELALRQTIENPLARRHRLGALDQGAAAAREEVRAGTLDVEYEIRLHFYRILYLQELVDLARLNAEALDEVRELIEVRARMGEVKELEAIRLRVEHMRAQNRVQAAELELAQFRQHLNMFLGNVLPDDYALAGELNPDPTVPELETLNQRLLQGHPLLRGAARAREAADQRRKESQVGWMPSPVVSVRSAQELDGDILKVGVGFEIPLWNQSRAATERDRETLRKMEYREEDVRLDLQARLMIHHNNLLLHRQTLLLFQEGLLEEADVSMEIAEISYREGEISLIEYLDARRTYQSIQIEYQQAQYDWSRELAELNRAAGGGVL